MQIVQTETIAAAAADWAKALSFAMFNPSKGTLTSVEIDLTADVGGSISVANLEGGAATITGWLVGSVGVSDGNGQLVSVAPTATGTASLAASDGSTDFSGSSGTVLGGLVGQDENSVVVTGGLTSFTDTGTGTGSVPLTVTADVQASESGPANVLERFLSNAHATVSLIYNYSGTVSGGSSGGDVITTEVIGPVNGTVLFLDPTTAPQACTIAPQTTGWNDPVTVTGFDTTLGTLLAVNVTLVGGLSASMALQDLGTAGTVGATDQGVVTLDRPDGSSVVAAAPTVAGRASLAAYDGSQDFSGPSAQTLSGLSQQQTVQATMTDTSSLAEFLGTGPVVLPVTSRSESTLDGPGKLLASLQAAAGAEVIVSYTYQPADPPCFAAGTRIRTPRGEVAVEALRPGELVETASGRCVPVVWTGQITVDLTGHPRPWDVNPVHVLPRAFGNGRPHRQLVLSPDHAVFVDGVLVPVRHLLNGATICQRAARRITWHHVELPRHDVLLAEGLPAESYLDTGNRPAFEGGAVAIRHPGFAARYGRAPPVRNWSRTGRFCTRSAAGCWLARAGLASG